MRGRCESGEHGKTRRQPSGILAPGYAADITAFDRRTIDFAGSDWDPLASLLFCGPVKASHTVINGRHVVANGQLTTMEMGQILERHTAMAHHLMQKSGLVG